MTAVIYARYSTDSQREESIEGQIRECTAYAEKNGITIVKHYIDRAVSAKTDNRPQFQQIIKDSERGIFDIIIVWKLDCFARNRYDSARNKTQLKRNGVKLVSATEVISAGPEGIILESVLEGYAECYSADLSEKVVRGMTENTLKGIYNGGTIPFGYMIDETRHYQPDPLLAPYVEQTFQKYAEGATMTDLRDWLKAHNIKNSMGGEMSYNTIQRMLSNRRSCVCGMWYSPMRSRLLCQRTCSTKYRKSWRKTKKPLSVIRQRKAICSPPSCTAASAVH